MQNPAQVEEPPQTPPMIVDARETEVEDLYRAIRANFDVRGFEVAMNDALLVRGFESLGDLHGNRQSFIERDRAARHALRQVLALDEFHHQRVLAGRFIDRVDRGDVGVIERGERFGLALKSGEAFGVRRQRLRQNLDRHRSGDGPHGVRFVAIKRPFVSYPCH